MSAKNITFQCRAATPFIPSKPLRCRGKYLFLFEFYFIVSFCSPHPRNRAARSGNAFGFGLFEGMGTLGPSDYKPFYTYSSSLSLDTTLRFFDICPQYQTTVRRTLITLYTMTSLLFTQVLDKQWGEKQAKQYEALFLPATALRISKLMGTSR